MNRRDFRQQRQIQANESERLQERGRLEAFVRYCEASVVICKEYPGSPQAKGRLNALLAAAQHSHWKVENPYENWRRAEIAGHCYVESVFPGVFPALEHLRNGETGDVEPLLGYLEADPYFFHSGFLAVRCITYLKRADPTVEQIERIRKVLLMVVDKGDRREFRHYCWLARRVTTPLWEAALLERITSPDRGIARRSRWMLNVCKQR